MQPVCSCLKNVLTFCVRLLRVGEPSRFDDDHKKKLARPLFGRVNAIFIWRRASTNSAAKAVKVNFEIRKITNLPLIARGVSCAFTHQCRQLWNLLSSVISLCFTFLPYFSKINFPPTLVATALRRVMVPTPSREPFTTLQEIKQN